MGWNTLLNNQCISFNNLQDGCNQLFFINSQPIPVSTEQITKQNFLDYIYTASIPAVLQYPPFVNKTSNELIVRGDVEVYGGATLTPNYGIVFTGIYYYNFNSLQNIAVGLWSLPAFSNQNSQYYSTFGIVDYNWLYIEVDGTSTSPSEYFSVTLSVNGNIISSGNFYYISGPQSAIVPIPNQYIYAPDNIEITIVDGQAIPVNVSFQDQNGGIPIVSVSASRGSGQYQMVATGNITNDIPYLKGSLYRSTDYGATFQQAGGDTLNYWNKVVMSDTGQYMIANSFSLGPLVLSSNYGASYTNISSRVRGNTTEYWQGLGISGNGRYIVTSYSISPGRYSAKISNNYGAVGSWTEIPFFTNKDYYPVGVAISNDGQFIYLSFTDFAYGYVLTSSNYGVSWQTISVGTQYVRDISCSSDGTTVVVTGSVSGYDGVYLSRGFMFKSTNYGASYTGITNGDYLRNWSRVGQLYTVTTPYSGYGTVMTYFNDQKGELTFPAETYPVGGDTLGSVVNSSVTGMGQRIFTDCAVGGTGGTYRLLGSTTGLFRSTNSGGSWTQL